jgi:RimJ/RimL family protein N-acetyltransferase
MEPVELSVGFLTLRPPQPVDAAWVYDACQDPEIARWTRVPSPYRAGDAVSYVRGARRGWETGEELRFVIVVTDTGELLGTCGLVVDGPSHVAEIGYWLAWEARGHGVASAAVGAVVGWAPWIGVTRLTATVKVGNSASEAVLARCGFVMTEALWSCFTTSGAVPAHRWERVVG